MLFIAQIVFAALAVASPVAIPTPKYHKTGAFSPPDGNFQVPGPDNQSHPQPPGRGPHGHIFNSTEPPHQCFNLTALNITGPFMALWNSTDHHHYPRPLNVTARFSVNGTMPFTNGTLVCFAFNGTHALNGTDPLGNGGGRHNHTTIPGATPPSHTLPGPTEGGR